MKRLSSNSYSGQVTVEIPTKHGPIKITMPANDQTVLTRISWDSFFRLAPYQPKPRGYYWFWLAVRGAAIFLAALVANLLMMGTAF